MAQLHLPPHCARDFERGVLALSCDSRSAVEAVSTAADAHGGRADINPVQDLGFLYRNLIDPDGPVWEAMWMDPAAIPSG